jgi:plastocyanin
MRGRRDLVKVWVAAASVVVALSGCGGSTEEAGGVDLSAATFEDHTSEDVVVIDAVDNSFKEKYVEVKAGTEVTFRNDGRNVHNVLPVVEGKFSKVEADDFGPGVETTITFDEPGDYPYYCSLHGTTSKGMVGAVRVIE